MPLPFVVVCLVYCWSKQCTIKNRMFHVAVSGQFIMLWIHIFCFMLYKRKIDCECLPYLVNLTAHRTGYFFGRRWTTLGYEGTDSFPLVSGLFISSGQKIFRLTVCSLYSLLEFMNVILCSSEPRRFLFQFPGIRRILVDALEEDHSARPGRWNGFVEWDR